MVIHWGRFSPKMLYSESSDTLHCLPIHSSSSLFAQSTTLITIFTCLYLFTTSPLLTLVLSPFSLCSKISWSNLLNNRIPLLLITLAWQHLTLTVFNYPLSSCLCWDCEGCCRKRDIQKIGSIENSWLPTSTGSQCWAFIQLNNCTLFSRQLALQSFLHKTYRSSPILAFFLLFNGIWVPPFLIFLISVLNTNPFLYISNFHSKPSPPSSVSLSSLSPLVHSHQHLNMLKSFLPQKSFHPQTLCS